MFGLFKKSAQKDPDSFLIGGEEYRNFKELSQKSNITELFVGVCAGGHQVPFSAQGDVQKMVGFAQTLISITGLGIGDLVKCAKSNKWTSVEDRLSRASASLRPMIAKALPALERLRAWANMNELPPLTQFDSSAYQMTGFPRDLNAIFTLRQLHLPDAGLSALPAELASLPALESVCVDRNKLKEFPAEIFSVYSLQRIDAEGNEIESIPDSIGNAQHLKMLDLDGNNLSSISREIIRCRSLKRLNLREQRHGTLLGHRDTPLSNDAMEALASLDSRGVEVRF